MSILAIQGTPGSGKSSIMVADMAEFLLSGGVVAMNFDLSPNWLDILCNTSFRYRTGRVDRELFRRSLYDRCFKIGTQDTILDLGKRLHGLTKLRGKQGVGRLYIDESQLLFNSREWKGNMGFIEFFTQHRKLGWDVYLITHTLDMIDKQIRGLVELETRLRDLQKVKLLGLFPVPWLWLCFKPTFLAITRYAGISAGAGEKFSTRLIPLSPSYKDLYDTCEVFAFNKASVASSPQGEYTPAPPRIGLFEKLWAKLFPAEELPQEQKTAFKSRMVGSLVVYYDRIIPAPPAAPCAVSVAPLGGSYSKW